MKIVINPAYSALDDFIQTLPTRFELEGEVIYSGRNTLKRYQVKGVDLVVKSFKVPIFINRIAYSLFRKSKALRSYVYALEILKRGCDTPAPIAYIEEYVCGLLKRSYYIAAYNAEAVTIRNYLNDLTRPDVLRGFSAFTAQLHAAGILHIDYSPGNILVNTLPDGTSHFSIIDINRLCFKEVSIDEAYHNFDRICHLLPVSTFLATCYAGQQGLNEAVAVAAINKYSDHFFLKKTYKDTAKRLKKNGGWRKALFGSLHVYLNIRRLRKLTGGKEQGALYEKERALYWEHIEPADIRHVLSRRYHY